jgi:methionine aminotransferase
LQKEDIYTGLSDFYQKKRDTFLSLVKPSRFKGIPCQGTYFQMLDYSDISTEPDTDFAKRMTIDYGLASIPPSVFYRRKTDNRMLRFCFAKNNETLKRAAKILCKI